MNKRKIGTLVITGLLITSLIATPVSAILVPDGLFDFFGDDDKNEVEEVREKWEKQNDLEDTQTETDMNYLASATNTQLENTLDIHSNYLQDSETRAWSLAEAKMISRLKEAQENNENITESELKEIGNETIEDYYARQQISLAEVYEGGLTNAEYIYNVTEMEDGLSNNFVTMNGQDWLGETYAKEITLANGTNYTSFGWEKPDAKGNIMDGKILLEISGYENSFEDGTKQGWATTRSGVFEASNNKSFVGTNNTYDGDYSLAWNSGSESFGDIGEQYTVNSPQNFSFYLEPSKSTVFMISDSGDDSDLISGPKMLDIYFEEKTYNSDGDYDQIRVIGGGSISYEKQVNDVNNIAWKIEINNIDYTNEKYDIKIINTENNEIVWKETFSFQESGNYENQYAIKAQTQDGSNSEIAYLDGINLNRNTSNIEKIYTNPSSNDLESETIMELQPFRDRYTAINETAKRLTENFALYANKTYEEYQAGNMTNLSDYVSAGTLAQEYQQKYNETGYWGYAMAYLAANGLETPNLNNTSMMYIEYEENGTMKKTQGMLMSQKGPTYQDSNYTNGTWYVNHQYDATEIEGMQIIVPTESDEMIELEGNFTITRMLDKEGEDINSSSTKEYVYKTANTTELQNLQEDLSELRQELEDREPKVGGTLDSTDSSLSDLISGVNNFFSNIGTGIMNLFGSTIAGIPIAIIIVLLVGFALINN